MTKLHHQLAQMLLPGMSIPEPLELLFEWIEAKGFYVDTEEGVRIGFLYPDQELREQWTETERPGGTMVEFFAQGNADLKYWFGQDDPAVLNRLCVFAKTGGDGSMAAFWLDEAGDQKIVHLGSGSGSTLTCVLADDALDFLRLLAIGYDEICWNELFDLPPNAGSSCETHVHPNVEFQNWVMRTFSTTVPITAAEIVRHPASMDDDDSEDPFCRWVNAVAG